MPLDIGSQHQYAHQYSLLFSRTLFRFSKTFGKRVNLFKLFLGLPLNQVIETVLLLQTVTLGILRVLLPQYLVTVLQFLPG